MGFFKNLFSAVRSSMNAGKDYAKYTSMTKAQFLGLEDDELLSALSTVLELEVDDPSEANEHKVAFLAVSALYREVNNGGLCQFFVNSSSLYAPYVSRSLELVRAKKIKEAFDCFVSENIINLTDLSEFKIKSAADFSKKTELYPFDRFDDLFYELEQKESEEHLLLRFIRKNPDELLDFCKQDKKKMS